MLVRADGRRSESSILLKETGRNMFHPSSPVRGVRGPTGLLCIALLGLVPAAVAQTSSGNPGSTTGTGSNSASTTSAPTIRSFNVEAMVPFANVDAAVTPNLTPAQLTSLTNN